MVFLVLLLAVLASAQATQVVYATPAGQAQAQVYVCPPAGATYIATLSDHLNRTVAVASTSQCTTLTLPFTAPQRPGNYSYAIAVSNGSSTVATYRVYVVVYPPPWGYSPPSPWGYVAITAVIAGLYVAFRHRNHHLALALLLAGLLAAVYGVATPVCYAGICNIDYVSIAAVWLDTAAMLVVAVLYLLDRL